jgi:hypothetical protein
MARLLPALKVDYDAKDQELALAIADALGPLLSGNVIQSGNNFPNNPITGQIFYYVPDNQIYYFDGIRGYWLSNDLITAPFARRGSTGNNILLRMTDSMVTDDSGFAIPWDGSTMVVGLSADWVNVVTSAGLQIQADGLATVANVVGTGSSSVSNFGLIGIVPPGFEYLTIRTNGLTANLTDLSATLYLRRYRS